MSAWPRSIIPAADLSEQISTAGMEASGTGNMKLALNGALTIGTLDGANVEIREHVGGENIFIFGLTADEVDARRRRGLDAERRDRRLARARRRARRDRGRRVLAGRPRPVPPRRRPDPLCRSLYDRGGFRRVPRGAGGGRGAVARPAAWGRAAALNIARIGWFSSDRTIAEYAADIWNVPVAYR